MIVSGDMSGEQDFEKAMWDFCKTTAGLEPPPSRREFSFVAWAPDSSRLLLALRVDIKGSESQWKTYWNTRTRSFELTSFLKELNERAPDVFGGRGTHGTVARDHGCGFSTSFSQRPRTTFCFTNRASFTLQIASSRASQCLRSGACSVGDAYPSHSMTT
jgi:hypothetical protein